MPRILRHAPGPVGALIVLGALVASPTLTPPSHAQDAVYKLQYSSKNGFSSFRLDCVPRGRISVRNLQSLVPEKDLAGFYECIRDVQKEQGTQVHVEQKRKRGKLVRDEFFITSFLTQEQVEKIKAFNPYDEFSRVSMPPKGGPPLLERIEIGDETVAIVIQSPGGPLRIDKDEYSEEDWADWLAQYDGIAALNGSSLPTGKLVDVSGQIEDAESSFVFVTEEQLNDVRLFLDNRLGDFFPGEFRYPAVFQGSARLPGGKPFKFKVEGGVTFQFPPLPDFGVGQSPITVKSFDLSGEAKGMQLGVRGGVLGNTQVVRQTRNGKKLFFDGGSLGGTLDVDGAIFDFQFDEELFFKLPTRELKKPVRIKQQGRAELFPEIIVGPPGGFGGGADPWIKVRKATFGPHGFQVFEPGD